MSTWTDDDHLRFDIERGLAAVTIKGFKRALTDRGRSPADRADDRRLAEIAPGTAVPAGGAAAAHSTVGPWVTMVTVQAEVGDYCPRGCWNARQISTGLETGHDRESDKGNPRPDGRRA